MEAQAQEPRSSVLHGCSSGVSKGFVLRCGAKEIGEEFDLRFRKGCAIWENQAQSRCMHGPDFAFQGFEQKAFPFTTCFESQTHKRTKACGGLMGTAKDHPRLMMARQSVKARKSTSGKGGARRFDEDQTKATSSEQDLGGAKPVEGLGAVDTTMGLIVDSQEGEAW